MPQRHTLWCVFIATQKGKACPLGEGTLGGHTLQFPDFFKCWPCRAAGLLFFLP